MKVLRFSVVSAIVLLSVTAIKAETKDLLLYGGREHSVFLGCLSCGDFDTDSVCNRFGTFGSKYRSESIWNRYSDYGSKFSTDSPWNEFSSSAPIIVDADGGFYGHLTVNAYHSNRTLIQALIKFLDLSKKLDNLEVSRDLFCDQ
jgi:hypothetical protein